MGCSNGVCIGWWPDMGPHAPKTQETSTVGWVGDGFSHMLTSFSTPYLLIRYNTWVVVGCTRTLATRPWG